MYLPRIRLFPVLRYFCQKRNLADSKTILLHNGVQMPIIGFGATSRGQSKLEEIQPFAEFAIDCGYRLIDTAYFYQNEKYIGAAIRKKISEGIIKREEIFVVTKLHGYFHAKNQVQVGLHESLQNLGLDYVDLFLIHTPIAFKRPAGKSQTYVPFVIENGKTLCNDIDYIETWQGMENCYKSGLVRAIGVSYFNGAQLQRIYDSAQIKPMLLQAECHGFLPEFELFQICKKLNVKFTAFAPIGSPNYSKHMENQSRELGAKLSNYENLPTLIQDAEVAKIAQKYSKTPAQVLLRWLIQRGIAVIPGSLNRKRIKENLDVFDFQIEDEDMAALGNLKVRKRLFTNDIWKNCKYYPH